MDISYVDNYFHNTSMRDSFDTCVKRIFGLDLGEVREKKIINDKQIAFSAFDGKECIASIGLYLERILLCGKYYKSGHLVGVGTLPEYRKKGIQKEIWKNCSNYIKENNIQHVYLSTNYHSIGFYRKVGFSRQFEHAHICELEQNIVHSSNGLRKLNTEVEEDWEIIQRIAKTREPSSDRIYIDNPNLFLFMCFNPNRQNVYYVDDLDCIVLLEEIKDRIIVHDVASKRMPEHNLLVRFLPLEQKKFVEYRFFTDKLNIPSVGRRFIDDSPLMIGKTFSKMSDVIFSFTINA